MERSAHSFLSDVSFDKTEEDLLDESKLRSGKSWKRPSAPPMELEEERHTPPKRQRDDHVGCIEYYKTTPVIRGKIPEHSCSYPSSPVYIFFPCFFPQINFS